MFSVLMVVSLILPPPPPQQIKSIRTVVYQSILSFKIKSFLSKFVSQNWDLDHVMFFESLSKAAAESSDER